VEIKKTLKPVRNPSIPTFSFTQQPGFLILSCPVANLVGALTWSAQDTEIWTASKLPFCQEHLAKPFEHMPQ
jgi:hypothetical protein